MAKSAVGDKMKIPHKAAGPDGQLFLSGPLTFQGSDQFICIYNKSPQMSLKEKQAGKFVVKQRIY